MTVGALLARGEARIADQLVELAGFEQTFPSLVVAGQMNHERFLITIEQAVNSPLGKIFPRHGFAAVQVIRNMGFDKRDRDLQERDIDELAAIRFSPRASSAAMMPWAAKMPAE